MQKTFSVLFLCTGNSARSILAEAYLSSKAAGRFTAYSAGSHPAGTVNPFALALLGKHGIDTTGLRSKSWDELAAPAGPKLDFVFTVCDNAAGEICPYWPGQPVTAHWGVEDPAAVEGTEEQKREAFLRAFAQLSSRIDLLLALPVERLDRLALIVAFGPRSGAHFNPVITAALALRADFPRREIAPYIVAQLAGAVLGVLLAHAMFDMPLLQASLKERASLGQWVSEAVATFGLVFVVLSCARERPWEAPLAVGAYIAAAYWFTASTSFANPAVTLARGFTATFAGIDPTHIAPFIAAQLAGAGLGLLADRRLGARMKD